MYSAPETMVVFLDWGAAFVAANSHAAFGAIVALAIALAILTRGWWWHSAPPAPKPAAGGTAKDAEARAEKFNDLIEEIHGD